MILCLLLAACVSKPADNDGNNWAIDENESLPINETDNNVAIMGIDGVSSQYSGLLNDTYGPVLRRELLIRVASLNMEVVEANDGKQGNDLIEAIAAYEEVVADYLIGEDSDGVLYQLSKAYAYNSDEKNQQKALLLLVEDYPESMYFVESQFRLAEMAFSQGRYEDSEKAYQAVLNQGEGNKYYQNALYMYGWSLFKQDKYDSALYAFSEVLDRVVPVDGDIDSIVIGDRAIYQDSINAMGIIFSYQNGVTSIEELHAHIGDRNYIVLLYDNLGQLYLNQERYRDTAGVYSDFVENYPDAKESLLYSQNIVNAYDEGRYLEEQVNAKELYVRRYAVDSEYWLQSGVDIDIDTARPLLNTYLKELASYYHAQWQQGTKQPRNVSDESVKSSGALTLAGEYYASLIMTFPDDSDISEISYFYAEVLFASRDYEDAINKYEQVSYIYKDEKYGADAGYNALIGYDMLMTGNDDEEKWLDILRDKSDSAVQFNAQYIDDERAPQVLMNVADALYKADLFEESIIIASILVNTHNQADPQMIGDAWALIGHCYYKEGDFINAEKSYIAARTANPNTRDPQEIDDLIAASIFQQGELLVDTDKKSGAINQFLRIAELAPKSQININAEYDAASLLMDVGDWDKAIEILNTLSITYPEHELVSEIPTKLAWAYQQNGNRRAAANQLDIIYAQSDEEDKREVLYLSAELYEDSGENQRAIERYKKYIHTYPEPYPVAMEARYKLIGLYKINNDISKEIFWMKNTIKAEEQNRADNTSRTLYIAAYASAGLASIEYDKYISIHLSHPINKSLAKKNVALKSTLAAYNKVAQYGVLEFTTLSNYKIAEVFSVLGMDLLNSERPSNIDGEDRERYEMLLEEQAYPFEEKAISIHKTNAERSWSGVYDNWVKESIISLRELMPAKYNKVENTREYSDVIY